MTFKTGLAVVNRPQAGGDRLRLLKDGARRVVDGLADEPIGQVVESSWSFAVGTSRSRNANEKANEKKEKHKAGNENQP